MNQKCYDGGLGSVLILDLKKPRVVAAVLAFAVSLLQTAEAATENNSNSNSADNF